MSIKCGTCGGQHPSISKVRACALGTAPVPVSVPVSPAPAGAVNTVLDRLRRQGQQRRPTERVESTRGYGYRSVVDEIDPIEEMATRPAWTAGPQGATPGAVKYATDRLRLRAWEGELTPAQYQTAEALMHGAAVDKDKCSELIDRLGKLPYRSEKPQAPAYRAESPVSAPPAPTRTQTTTDAYRSAVRVLKALVPDSRYAVEVSSDKLRFFLVKTTDKGYVVIKEYASDTLHDRRYTEYLDILQAIVDADPAKAQVRFGQELGHCYHCNRALTDEVSRGLGIGPVCRSK